MRQKLTCALFCIIILFSATILVAESSRTINYQGYLTDSSGEPANGTYGVTFYIYESLLTQMWMWSESHIVECENGLFSVVLGQGTPFQDSVFNGEDRYLGIRIGDDSEISPRTLITAVPHAFISQQMGGDIETDNGKLVMKDTNGDSVIVLESNADEAKAIGGSIKMFNPQPEPPAKMFEVNAYATEGSSLSLYNDIGKVMGVEPSPFGGAYSLKLTDPGDNEAIVEISSFPSTGGLIRMFNPQPEPPARLFEINVDATEGASMGFYSSNGALMTAGPDPLGGFMIRMEDEEEPVHAHLEMGSSFSVKGDQSRANGGYLSLYSPSNGLESHFEAGKLTLKFDVAGIPGSEINLNATGIDASIGIGTDSVPEALTVMGNGWFSGEVLTYTATKAKTNILSIDNALEKVSRMRGVYYDCKTDEYPQLRMPETRQVGFLAEEVKEVVPEIVGENEYGLTGVDYSRITALLVEAVKELKTQNEELKATNEDLIQRIEALENAR